MSDVYALLQIFFKWMLGKYTRMYASINLLYRMSKSRVYCRCGEGNMYPATGIRDEAAAGTLVLTSACSVEVPGVEVRGPKPQSGNGDEDVDLEVPGSENR